MNRWEKIRTGALTFYGSCLPNHPGKWRVHRALRRWLAPAVDRDLDVVRGRAKWRLNPADFMQEELFWMGTADRWETYHAQRLVRPMDVILDVGANFGFYSITLALGLRRRCRVHAFEPNGPTYSRLTHHIEVNDLASVVHAYCLGVSDAPGFATIVERSGNSGAASLDPTAREGPIELITLDRFAQCAPLDRLDFMKIDVEGFEERVLLGGQETLTRHQPVILIELEPARLSAKGSSVEAVTGLLSRLGYSLFVASRRRLRPLEVLPTGREQVNAFCFPPSRQPPQQDLDGR